MKRTVKALQDLYVKLGGQLTDTYANIADGIKVGLYKRIPDIIEAVKEKASGGGGGAGLPEVTVEDNGDVLTVVEGAWTKSAPSGALIVGIEHEYDEQTENEHTHLDKTWQEIYDAMPNVVVVEEYDDAGMVYQNKSPVLSISSEYDGNQTSNFYLYLSYSGGEPGLWWAGSANGYPEKSV